MAPHTLLAGKAEMVELFLSKLLMLREPGRYTLTCHTVSRFCQDVAHDDDVAVEASAPLTILPPDQRAMGEVIDRLGRAATSASDSSKYPNKELEKATESLSVIQDERVIPWLVRMFQMRTSNRKYTA